MQGKPLTQTGIKYSRRNIINLTYADDTTLIAESKEEPKSLLMKVKEECEKDGFKTKHSKNKDHSIWFYHVVTNGRGKKQTQ